jgi:2-oxoisovalerate dehydrogenase E1 component
MTVPGRTITETIDVSAEKLLEIHASMARIRAFEERMREMFLAARLPGFVHLYVGEEAIASGVCAALRQDDYIASTHRGHGHALAKGLPPAQLIAELYGRATGCSRGRGGSMHLFAPEVGLLGTSGIVGPCILQAAGAGYTFKLLKIDRVGVAFFGDGAVNNGAFHEGLNMASIWKLPTLFVCENNQYATEVPFRYASGNPSVSSRGAAYGMPGIEVDGNDVLAVHQAAEFAVARARKGDGPTLIECLTYRTRPHAEGMGDFTYRTKEEVEEWKKSDPIVLLRRQFVGTVTAVGGGLAEIDAAIQAEVDDAIRFAEDSPWPDPATACEHVFSA